MTRQIVDLTDEQARRSLVLKWGSVPADVLPAWVAEMDYQVDPVVMSAVRQALEDGVTGYPDFDSDLGPNHLSHAYAGFAQRHFDQLVEPAWVLPVSDVTMGARVLIDVFSERAPVVFPTPGYNAQHGLAQVTGREQWDLPIDPDAARAEIDLDHLDALLSKGARTLLLTQPHNPWGRAFTRVELEGIRDVVLRRGARVVSDEIHAPLVLPGAKHVSYLDVEGTHDHACAVVAASKAFNTAGLRCAQMIVPRAADRAKLLAEPLSRNDSWSPLGVVAAVAAYSQGDEWLASLIERLDAQRSLFAALLSTQLPVARMRPIEASYLAWVDLRAYGHEDPSAVALQRGRVKVSTGQTYAPGLPGHVRVNIATSPSRLTEVVRRLATIAEVSP